MQKIRSITRIEATRLITLDAAEVEAIIVAHILSENPDFKGCSVSFDCSFGACFNSATATIKTVQVEDSIDD